jgi:hypothetical protein
VYCRDRKSPGRLVLGEKRVHGIRGWEYGWLTIPPLTSERIKQLLCTRMMKQRYVVGHFSTLSSPLTPWQSIFLDVLNSITGTRLQPERVPAQIELGPSQYAPSMDDQSLTPIRILLHGFLRRAHHPHPTPHYTACHTSHHVRRLFANRHTGRD